MARSTSSFFYRVFHWRYAFIVHTILILLIAFSFGREVIRRRSVDQEIRSLQQQSASLQAQNNTISNLRSAVQTESFIEREARLKLDLKKPGERLLIIKGLDESDKKEQTNDKSSTVDSFGSASDLAETKKTLANSTKWWYYFFNKSKFTELTSYAK